jgi:glucoamylase
MDFLHSSAVASLNVFSNFNITAAISEPIMHSFTSLLVVGGLAFQSLIFAFPEPSRVKQREAEILKRSVDSFIATESPIALADMLCNIGSTGTCVSGASSGIVIASPDKANPDCKHSSFCTKILLSATLGKANFYIRR